MPTPTEERTETETVLLDPAYKIALDARRASLRALSEDLILRDLRLDASRAADVGEGTAKKLEAYRAEIAAEFGEHRAALVDRLTTTARAAKQADVELALAEPSRDLTELAKDVSEVYEMLIADATSLWKRRLIDGTRLQKAREIKGYQALLKSTLVLIALLREEWPKIAGRSILLMEDLDRAEQITQRLAKAIAHRDENADIIPARELRARALSVLVREYEELRRIMRFLRHYKRDVNDIIPSLWALRGRNRRGERLEEPVSGDSESSEPPTPTPGDDGSPFTP